MLAFKDGFTIYSKGKQTLIAIGVCLIIGLGIFLGVKSYLNMRHERDLAVFSQSQLQVKYQVLEKQLVQAQNNPTLNEAQLKELLSKEYQTVLEKHKQEVLAVIKAQFKLQGHGGGTGDSTPSTEPDKFPVELSYPAQGKQDPIMESIKVNTVKPTAPVFTFVLKPINIALEGSLNYDKDEKTGNGRFWIRPSILGAPDGLKIDATDAQLTPSPSFENYLASLRTGASKYPVPAKYSVGLLAGREFAKEFQGGYRNVYGFDLTRNFNNGLGLGGGLLGSSGYIRVVYSFGK